MSTGIDKGVGEIEWFHSIDLGGGVVTPGREGATAAKLRRLRFPESLVGRTVLDVGAWDGFFSFEAERRGAERVLATDWYCWSGPGWGTKDGFEYARGRLGSSVEDQEIDVLDLSPEAVGGQFDVVLFLGGLYHMRYPLLSLEKVASVTRELAIIETEVAHLLTRQPVVRYFLEGDDWCAPTLAACRAMLADVGFRRVEVIHRYSLPQRVGRAVKWRLQKGRGFFGSVGRGRAVIHAWK
jgi:tRNA (mo5U34)-methyltransferase